MRTNLEWAAVLTELEAQMTQATFDTLLRGTSGVVRDGTLEVRVKSQSAADWLENRQLATIERTVGRLAGEPLEVRFVVESPGDDVSDDDEVVANDQPVDVAARRFQLPDYDVHEAGWFPISEYECRFWAPILGRVAWRVWEIVRRADKRRKKSMYTPSRRWTAPALAELVPCGRQAILGVDRACGPDDPGAYRVNGSDSGYRYHVDGAFDRLKEYGLAVIERQGEKRHTAYWIQVRVKLGLLLPEYVLLLPSRLQVQHDRWLEEHGFEPEDWRVRF